MNFFDNNPALHPWPRLLRRSPGISYKPREVFWQNSLKQLGFLEKDQVLEIGCGPGVLLDRLGIKYKFFGIGIDTSLKAIKIAKQDQAWGKNQYLIGDAEQLPFLNSNFDKVITFDVLEHLKNQPQAIKEMARVLRAKGKILIYTINRRQEGTWNWILSKIGIDIYKPFDHKEELFVDPDKLRNLLQKEGIKIKKTIYFNSFFSLITDEVIMLFLKMWGRVFGWEKYPGFAMIVLRLLTFFSKVSMPILYILDLPWVIRGYSNSFLIIGQKQ